MTEFIKINGQAIRLSRFYRRSVTSEESATPLDEIEVVVMLRGRTVQRAFQELLRQASFEVEIPDEDSLQMKVASASMQTSGTGEAAAHRYDVTFRETEASAARRLPDPATEKEAPTPPPCSKSDEPEPEPAEQEIDWNTASVAWASALRQRDEAANPAPPPEEPLTAVELAGAEAVLVGLRMEALIGALEQAGVIQRAAIDESFAALVSDRFVTEATPVIGEDAARRVATAALGNEPASTSS